MTISAAKATAMERGALHAVGWPGRARQSRTAIARAVERLGGTVLTECAVRTVERASGKVSGGRH